MIQQFIRTSHYRVSTNLNTYLKSYLTGKALTAIDGIQITNDNYAVAVELLRERFGRSELIIDEHMACLLQIRPVQDAKNVERLRSMLDAVQTGVRSLEALGVNSDSYGVLLLSVLRNGVPSELNLEYHRKHDAEQSTRSSDELLAFLKFLKNEVKSRERSQYRSKSSDCDGGRNDNRQKRYPPSAAALTLGMERESLECIFCASNNHASKPCDSPISLDTRKAILARDNRCFRCAKRNHRSRECRNSKWLKCAKCSGRHITPLCDPNWANKNETATRMKTPVARAGADATRTQATLQSSLKITDQSTGCSSGEILLQTAQVWAEGRRERVLVRLLLDGGCQRTFIRSDLSKRLGLRVLGEEDITIFTFGEDATGEQRTCRRVELCLTSQHDRRDVRVGALQVPMICSDVMKAPVDILRYQLHAQGIVIADASLHGIQCEDGISVLIGADNYWAMVTGGLKRLDKTLVAVETIFGWTVQGPTTTDSSATRSSTGVMRVAVTGAVNREISAQLRAFWELEHMGIKEEQTTVTNENEIINQFEDTVKVENGRYQVSFPWNEKVARLRDNKDIAMKRLGSLTKRLLRDEQIMKEYDTGIREYMENGFAEEAPETAIASPNPVYYMRHQSVVRCDSQTTKLRIVFDASSSAPGCLSLNDTFSAGPNLNPSLIDLLKFWIHQIAVLADIEKAFLQVSLSEEDSDALRFLWYKETPLPGMELPPIVTWTYSINV
ncbi:uncharacterized protein LOC135390698 [Ornithodoros turicata]|uniref:uncharacterized protein LOC135390698 n=1 Tax=Ornithodoros turicata TaxID=34597 RepID=UPI00313A4023